MDIKRLTATLGHPALDRVLRRMRRRLEQGGTTSGTLVLSAPTEDERRAVARLFGTRVSRARSLTIDLHSLEALLREGELAPTLRDALESLGGPIPDLRARDAALQDRWTEVFTQCRLRVGTSPALNAWVDGIHSTTPCCPHTTHWAKGSSPRTRPATSLRPTTTPAAARRTAGPPPSSAASTTPTTSSGRWRTRRR